MNRIFLALLFSPFLYQPASAQPLALASDHSSQAFQLVKKKGDIRVYERWFEVEGEDRETRELKSEFVVPAGLDKVLQSIQYPEKVAQWMKSVGEIKVIEGKATPRWMYYLRYDIPWPLSDQDCVMRYQLVRDNGNAHVWFRSVSDTRYPPEEGVKRIEGLQGLWRFEPLGPGKTRVTYSVLILEKPSLPRWVTDPVVRANMLDSMVAFHKVLSE